MKAILLAALLAAAPMGVFAATYGARQAGTSAAAFLTLGADARGAAMGGAVSATADDASALYWNPADLASVHERNATFAHSASYQSTFHDFLAYAQPARRGKRRGRDLLPDQLGAFGAAVLYQDSGRIAEVDNTGAPTGDSFAPRDYAAIIGWGAELVEGIDAGIAAKYISSRIQAGAATGAADFGARWRARIPATEIGFALSGVVRNVGGQLKFRTAADPLPLAAVVGSALKPLPGLTLTADLTTPRDASPYASFGVEWSAAPTEGILGALRAGYDGSLPSSDVGGTTGLCLGGGLRFKRLGFDYAWTPDGSLGDTQRFSVSYRF